MEALHIKVDTPYQKLFTRTTNTTFDNSFGSSGSSLINSGQGFFDKSRTLLDEKSLSEIMDDD
jgi:hypothetical protein